MAKTALKRNKKYATKKFITISFTKTKTIANANMIWLHQNLNTKMSNYTIK